MAEPLANGLYRECPAPTQAKGTRKVSKNVTTPVRGAFRVHGSLASGKGLGSADGDLLWNDLARQGILVRGRRDGVKGDR